MEGLRSTPGFWGPSLLADITLVVQILFYLSLCAGVVSQLQRKYKWHDRFQIPVVVLNIFFIIFVMVPTFTGVARELPAGISQPPILVSVVHGLLGTIAQGLGIYCLLAGLKVLPRKIGVLRYWMWAAFTFWTLTILFGIGVYIFYYTGGQAAAGGDLAAEHDAEHVEEVVQAEAPAEEAVAEHAEEAAPAEASAEGVTEHAEEPVQAEAPAGAEEAVTEHAEEAVTPGEPLTATVEAVAEGGETEPGVSEHAEEVAEATPEAAEPQPVAQTLQGQWQLLQPVNEPPNFRHEHAVTFDPATNRLFLFGGRNGNQIKDDTWSLNVEERSWNFLAANSPTAPVLYSTAIAANNGVVYVGSGQGPNGPTNDMWRLDLATQIWENLGPGSGAAPEPRYGGPVGNLGGNLVVTHGFGAQSYDDTWRFNPETGQWEDITPEGARPSGRGFFAATPLNSNLVIHGGCGTPDGGCALDDAWILDTGANVWREILSDVRPAGRQRHTLVADEANQVILFGGQDASQSPLNDIWVLDVTTGVWQQVAVGEGPSPRYNHSAAWIPGEGMLIFGGRNNEGALNDMWLLTLGPAAAPVPAAEPTVATEATATPAPAEPAPAEPTPTPEIISEHDGN